MHIEALLLATVGPRHDMRLVGGARALEQARSLDQTLRLLLGRWHPRTGPARGRRAVPAGHHRGHARGQEGTCRPRRRRARELTILEGTAARPQAARARDGSRARGRRRGAGLLAGDRGSVAEDARPALLGAQDRQCLEQAAEEPAIESQAALQEIWMAETKKDALAAFDAFVETWGVKYDKAVE